MEDKPPLPDGWIVRRSRSYPDRVYYFNVNTGESSWEFPDLVKSGHVFKRHPDTPQSKSSTNPLNDIPNNNKRKLSETIHSPLEENKLSSTQIKSKESEQPARKKVKISPIKFPQAENPKTGILHEPGGRDQKKEKVTRNLKVEFNDQLSVFTGLSHLNRNHNAESSILEVKSPTKIVLNTKSRDNHQAGAVSQKEAQSKESTCRTSQTKSGMYSLSVPVTSSKEKSSCKSQVSIIPKLSQKHVVSDQIHEKNRAVISKKDLHSLKTYKNVKKDETISASGHSTKTGVGGNIKNSSAEEVPGQKTKQTCDNQVSDKRKVVKSLQQENEKLERTVVAKKGAQLTVKAQGSSSKDEEKDYSHHKPLFNLDDESPPVSVDSDNEGKVKNFIGNKEKLLSIQSWIDNLQEGSDSPRKEFYGLQSTSEDTVQTDPIVNDFNDSGFISPAPKTERGWPGTLKSSLLSSRQLVNMELDTWHLPEVDTTRVEEPMDVDIDEVIYEARQIIKSGTDVGQTSKENWEPSVCEIPILQNVVIVIDTNIFLTNLNLVHRLKDKELPEIGKPILFIPWIVLRELDVIKSKAGGKRAAIKTRARMAIWLLKSLITNNFENVIGQTPRQDMEASKEFNSVCNDDKILQACLQCQNRYEECEVILYTNDNNLTVKSLVANVQAYNSSEIDEGLAKLCSKLKQIRENNKLNVYPIHKPNQQTVNATTDNWHSKNDSKRANNNVFSGPKPITSCDNFSVPVSQQPIPSLSTMGTGHVSMDYNTTYHSVTGAKSDRKPANSAGQRDKIPSRRPTENTCMADTLLHEEQTYTVEALAEDMHTKLTSVLKEAFGKVLEEEMKLAYEDIWLQIVYRKPPWSFLDILECLKKHWIAVFGSIFNRSLIANVERLQCAFESKKSRSLIYLHDICLDALEILRECVQRNRYGETMFGIKECVLCLYELCEGLIYKDIHIQSISSLNHYLKMKLVPSQSNVSAISPQPVPDNYSITSPQQPHNNINSPRLPANNCQSLDTTSPQQAQLPYNYINNNSFPVNNGQSLNGPIEAVHPAPIQEPTALSQFTQPAGDKVAGELLHNIWQFIGTLCDKISHAVGTGHAMDVEKLLHQIVPVAKDLRILYVGLLEIPMPELCMHEADFTRFTEFCNTFYSRCGEQEIHNKILVQPVHFLMLISDHVHRETLVHMQMQLDDMLRRLYHCLQAGFPDD